MKISWLTIVLLVLVFATSRTQGQGFQPDAPPNTGQGTIQAQDTPYAAVDRGANHCVWQRTTYETTPDGKQIPHIHKYTELATGLNFWDSTAGQWVESKEQIDILANGTAAATQGQHQAYFPGDIYNGEIKLVTPDGQHLKSRPSGLSYDDGTNTVLIAELKHSVGELAGSNQVIYPDAFTDFKADLRYTYTKAGFEQDIILREQPLAPEKYGLNSDTAKLQVLTEFFDTPEPVQETMATNAADPTLVFGQMRMGQGMAFSTTNSLQRTARTESMLVSKSWQHLEGRTFLVEELPYQRIKPKLESLPVSASANTTVSSEKPVLHKVSSTRLLTPMRLVQAGTNTMQQAKAGYNRQSGVVLDYVLINTSLTDYTFQGDTTYYVSGEYVLSGNTTFEGGTVIKLDGNGQIDIVDFSTINCKTGPYRPAIFTSMNDDSVGEVITNSSGEPIYYDVSTFLSLRVFNVGLHDMRFSYCNEGINQYDGLIYSTLSITDCQFVNVDVAIRAGYVDLHNVLFAGTDQDWAVAFGATGYNALFAENVTVDGFSVFAQSLGNQGGWWPQGWVPIVILDNCLITGCWDMVWWAYPYQGVLVTNATVCVQNPTSPVYQTVGAGNYYLADDTYRNAGTTNITPGLLSALRQKTTYPPVSIADNFSANTTLYPRVQRDTDAPDLGYHYDPLDFAVSNLTVNNGITLTLTNGTALGVYGTNLTINGSLLIGQQISNAMVQEQSATTMTVLIGTNSAAATLDSDHDGLPDWWELQYFGNLSETAGGDFDGDGISNLQEYLCGANPSLAFLTQPANQTVIQGSNVTFSVTVNTNGTTPLSYQWYFNGTNLLAGATNASLALTNVQTTNAGNYSLVVFNACGSITSSNAAMTVMNWTVDSDYDGVSDAREIVDGTDPNNPNSVWPVRLGYWPFDNTNTWVGDTGQLPLLTTNIVGVPSWNTNAVLIDSTNSAILAYRDVETNGNANINLRTGTIRFWFKPDWGSADQGGTGPGTSGRLIEVGDYSPAFTNGWWALYLSPDGTLLTFGSSTNGAGNTSLSTSVSWTAKRWHQIVLTYSPTNSTLYWDGQEIVTDETGLNYYPSLTERTDGFRIGSDASGENQARGVFEELETFNYQLSATDIANDYDYATNSMPAPPTVAITNITNYSAILVGANQALTIKVDAEAASSQTTIQEVDYSYAVGSGDPVIGISTLYPFSIIWTNADWTNLFDGTYSITAVAIDNLGVASDPYTVVNVAIELDSDTNGLADKWEIQYFGTNGLDPNSSPDGNGQTLLYDYQNGFDPTDYYNGQVPCLEILSGNNQAGNYDSFLLLPVTIEVTDAYSDALTNAPLTFTVTNGTALLATNVNGATASTLSLRTDSNGQASVWVYFPPASSNPPDSTIVVSASSGANSTTVTVNEYVPLAHWTFNDTNNWVGEEGQLPLLASNLAGVPSWSSNAVVVDNPSPALLAYNIVETNGNTNINCQTGSVLFYFKPDWSSDDEYEGGTGPGTSGRLIEIGNYDPAFTNGWWSLYLSPDGTQLLFATSTTNGDMTNLSATISWVSNTWYQIALAYSPTDSALFVDGQFVTNGAGVTCFPNADELTNGFRIGSDQNGSNQAAGTFDELETFASPLSGIGAPVDTYWFGIPDYQADSNGALRIWEIAYFGHIGLDPNSDPYGIGSTLLHDYQNGISPNTISFSFSVPNQYVTTNVVTGVITVLGGVPSSIAVLVDNTNLAGATWSAYTSSNITVNFGATDGSHDVWVGLMGSSLNAQPTWVETTLVLDSVPLAISITNPVDGASLNASRVNVSGNFTAASLKQVTVNGILAFINGTNFEALNVPLSAGANAITAVVEDLTGTTNAASITVTGTTNSDGSVNGTVQLQATPVAGFAPLSVAFQITSNSAPGTLQQVSYDFNGDGIADFTTNNLDSITYTYATNGQYFPVVTVQTTTGRFSSVGGWNSASLDPSNQPIRINVQTPATQSTLAGIADPVDIKWDGTHLYALSGSGAAIYEFATNGTTIRSLGGIGINPSGIDVDGAGNVYVAVTGSNQVWKLNPTTNSFQADTNFGIGGCIGLTNGASGTTNGAFNAPFDVAVSPDGGTISVSDSGNNRIQQFSATSGAFISSFGSHGSAVGQFNTPKGLTFDSSGTLYIVDSGNNRIVMAEGSSVIGTTGTGGTDLGQFSGPVNISVGERGVYVADTGNGRIQKFDPPAGAQFSITSSSIGYAVSSNLSAPAAVAAVDSLTNDLFYVADTGHDRIILCQMSDDNADALQAVWHGMVNRVDAGDIPGAVQYFSSLSVDKYQQAFLAIGMSNLIPAINQIGTLTPDYIVNDQAEYYFEQTIDGQTVTFPVEFVRENGVWKIMEF